MDLRETAQIKGDIARHWYYASKIAAVRRLAGGRAWRSLLDVGAGSGIFSRALLRAGGPAEKAVCVDPGYETEREEEVAGRPLAFVRSIRQSDADLVLLIDVLEHVDDPAGLLREYAGKTPEQASFIISVPAFQWLWSGHDEYLGHRRRYTAALIEQVVREAGLVPVQSCYYFAAVFPLAAAIRLAQRLAGPRRASPRSQLRGHGALVNGLLGGLCRIELAVFRFNRLFGLSVLCAAAKAPTRTN